MPSSSSSAETATPATAPAPARRRRRSRSRSEGARLVIFVGIFGSVLLASTLLTSLTWRHFSGLDGLAWIIVPAVLTLGVIPEILLGFRLRHPLLGAAYKVSALSLGILNYTTFAALACWFVAGVAATAGRAIDMRLVAFVLFGIALLIVVWGVVNAVWLRVTEVTITLPKLDASWEGRRVALVSDVHIGNVRGADFVRRIVKRLNALKVDAVLIAGDMFDGAKVDVAASVEPWRELATKHGAYFSTGNHDEFSDRQPYLAALAEVGIRVLNNEKIVVGGLQLAGVHDGESGDPAAFRSILERVRIDRERASILIAHQPSHLSVPEEAGVSLQVSGHTHGGQFWPWNLVVRRVHGRFGYGLNRHGKLQVLTSSGAGTWGPPLRVGTRSEIVVVTLRTK